MEPMNSVSREFSLFEIKTTAEAENVWNNVVAVVNAGALSFYINGVVDASTYNISTAAQVLTNIGNDSALERFNGRVAKVLFYNRALSTAEILQNYNNTKTMYGR